MTRQIKSLNATVHRNLTIERPAGFDADVLGLKQSLNGMVDQLNDFATEVARTARKAGKQCGQGSLIQAPAMAGAWKDLGRTAAAAAASVSEKGRVALKVFVVHEDTLTGVRATAVLERLADFLDNEPVIQSEIWKFDSLAQPALYDQALVQAAEADMIIISAGGGQSLPTHMAGLISEALARKNGRPAAVVALLDLGRTEVEPSRLCAEVRQMAGKTGVDFFCNTGESCWAAETAPSGPSLMANGILNFW